MTEIVHSERFAIIRKDLSHPFGVHWYSDGVEQIEWNSLTVMVDRPSRPRGIESIKALAEGWLRGREFGTREAKSAMRSHILKKLEL